MTNNANAQAAAEKFLALNSGNLAAYLESCVKCGQCATACHFYEVTGDPKYTPAYKLFPMAKEYGTGHVAIYGLVVGMAIMALSLLLFI